VEADGCYALKCTDDLLQNMAFSSAANLTRLQMITALRSRLLLPEAGQINL
jgi:hypothetical protein